MVIGAYDPELDAPVVMRDDHLQRRGRRHSKMLYKERNNKEIRKNLSEIG